MQNDQQNEEQSNVPVVNENESTPQAENVNQTPEMDANGSIVTEPCAEIILDEATEKTIEDVHPVELTHNESKQIDWSVLNKTELIKLLDELITNKPVQEIISDVENIKSNFYKKHRIELDEKKKAFIDAGGILEDFKQIEDEQETIFKQLYKKHKDQKTAYNEKIENDKLENLKAKYQIIEEIKILVSSKEKINKTYQDFRELQQRWHNTGPVPQPEVTKLWQTYHHHVEMFYDILKLNKEARDLDLKKNLEGKNKLCDRAEELLLEPLVTKAFQKLQELHTQWREIGPVIHEKQEEVWERFKAITTSINKRHQDYFDGLKHEQENNLEAKTMICEKADEVISIIPKTPHAWEEKTNELIELQKLWKTIGAVPKKMNTKIFNRFKDICDIFFANKKEFFKHLKDEQNNNLQLKIELCMEIEALKDNTDWRKTTDEIINLQKKWKEIGSTPSKHADLIWKRFRAACDTFFQNKEKFISSIADVEKENLQLKNDLIEKVISFVPSDDSNENINTLKTFQNNWASIGHVPIKSKDDIQKKFRDAINKQFSELKLDRSKIDMMQFKNKVENYVNEDRSDDKMYNEKTKIIDKIKTIEADLNLLENNIGFFAKSKNAESLLKDFKEKIEKAKLDIQQNKDKLKIIDNMMRSK